MEFDVRLLPPPPTLLEHLKVMDEQDDVQHDIGWTGSMYIDFQGLPWWEFVDPHDMLFACRWMDDMEFEIIVHGMPMVNSPSGPALSPNFIDRLEANVHQFMVEGPAFHEGE